MGITSIVNSIWSLIRPKNEIRLNRYIGRKTRVIILIVFLSSLAFPNPSLGFFHSIGLWSSYEKKYFQSLYYQGDKHLRGSNPFNVETTMKRLQFLFSVDFPTWTDTEKNILQTGDFRILDPRTGGELELPELSMKWEKLNPDFKYNYLTNKEIMEYLKGELYARVPEVYTVLVALPEEALQIEFSHYLWIFLNGGLYSDPNVEPLKPITNWLKDGFDSNDIPHDIAFMAGIEFDHNLQDWKSLSSRRIQLLQWTFLSKKGNAVLARIISNIVKTTFKAYFDGNLRVSPDMKLKSNEYVPHIDQYEWTGAGVFTDSVFQHLNQLRKLYQIINLNPKKPKNQILYGPNSRKKANFDWKTFTGNDEIVIVNDIGILPKAAFEDEGNCDRYCFAKHFSLAV